jgi:hypothetical protein
MFTRLSEPRARPTVLRKSDSSGSNPGPLDLQPETVTTRPQRRSTRFHCSPYVNIKCKYGTAAPTPSVLASSPRTCWSTYVSTVRESLEMADIFGALAINRQFSVDVTSALTIGHCFFVCISDVLVLPSTKRRFVLWLLHFSAPFGPSSENHNKLIYILILLKCTNN